MPIRLTLTGPDPQDPAGRWEVDVEVDPAAGGTGDGPGGAGTRWEHVEERLRALSGPWSGPPRVGGVRVPPGSLLGRRPLLDGAVVDVGACAAGAPARHAAGPARAVLAVTAGPDAGRELPLEPGTHVVGRRGAGVPVADTALSRRHLALGVPAGGGAVTVADLGSTNGTWLEEDGTRREVGAAEPLPGHPVRLHAGTSAFALDPPPEPPAAAGEDGGGHVLVNRAPRLRPAPGSRVLRLPGRPEPVPPQPFPWLAAAVPVALAVVMAVVWSPLSLLLGLASPVLVLGQWWGDRRRGARREEEATTRHAEDSDAVLEELARELAAEHAARHRDAPDAVTVLRVARGPGSRLWERGADAGDALELRLGTGDVPASTCSLDGDAAASVLHAVPVTVRLPEVGVLGVSGPRGAVLGCARSLLGQVATWHGPDEVAVAVLSAAGDEDAAADWGWAAWLPHARVRLSPGGTPGDSRTSGSGPAGAQRLAAVVAELNALVARGPGVPAPVPGRRVVVLLDGSRRLRAVPGIAGLLRSGPAAGVFLVCLDAGPADLPAECGAALLLPEETTRAAGGPHAGAGGEADEQVGGEAVLRREGHRPLAVHADGVSPRWAQDLARALAPLRDATPPAAGAALPEGVRLLELLRRSDPRGEDPLAPGVLARRWRRQPATTRFPVGCDEAGTVWLDLAADGPHALVAGTTGSGKSELLQTLVAGLAAANRPEELQFVLVDYKGGSAFGRCAGLPHCAGLVTDLDEHLTRRALRSLTAEVRRRERLLRAAGAPDLRALREGGGPVPFPRLVLVVDEFRVLAEELPDFVAGLVRIAAVGRSLGVHLVLATQRPAGVVSADIRANTNLRIALRVQDRADGVDVVGSPEPALLDERSPGRAVLRCGGGPARTVQVARAGGRAPAPGTGAPSVRAVRFGQVLAGAAGAAPALHGGDDLELLVDAVRGAAAELHAAAAASPWLPPLPGSLSTADLPTAGAAEPAAAPAWGLLDLPGEQSQPVARWDLTDGQHLLVVGAARSGRSTLLRTLVTAAGNCSAAVHCQVLDAGGTLADLAAHRHVGSLVGPEELWRAGRVLSRLLEEVQERRELLAAQGVRSLEEQHLRRPPAERLPYLVLVVDGWDSWARALADADQGAAVEAVQRLLREASALGVRVVLSGDRGLLTSAVAAATGTVVLLRLADRADAALAGVDPRRVPVAAPPGRGLRVRDGQAEEVQVAEPATPGTAGAAAAPATPAGAAGPWRVRALPEEGPVLPGVVVPAQRGRAGSPVFPRLLVGTGGDDGGPVHLDLTARGAGALVVGPAGSGRSSVLRVLAAQAVAAGWPVALVVGREAGREEPGGPVFPPGRGAELAAALDAAVDAGTPALVLADDVEALVDADVEDVLLRRLAAGTGERLVGAGVSADLAVAYRGLAVPLRRERRGLLLGTGRRVEGEVFGLRPLTAPGRGPGAGFVLPAGPGGEEAVPVRLARLAPAGAGGWWGPTVVPGAGRTVRTPR
ncbi:FtsK/SpoIIIE domain-containing protein [Kineococcus sp. NUM-3379]